MSIFLVLTSGIVCGETLIMHVMLPSKKFDNFIILLLYAAKCQEKAEMACTYMHERSLDISSKF